MREDDGDAWPVYRYTGIHRYTQVYTGIHRYTQVYTGIHRLYRYTGIQVHVPVLPALGQLDQLASGDGYRCSSPLNEAKGISCFNFCIFLSRELL